MYPSASNDDAVVAVVLGVTLGSVSVTAVFAVVCGWWLLRRRRRGHSDTTSDDGNSRLEPETTDNRLNESSTSSAARNNYVTSPSGRYARDGTLVLTITNDCAGNGSDVKQFAGRAMLNAKNDNASPWKSPGKSGVSTVSDDVSRFGGGRTATDDVNVWPYDEDCEYRPGAGLCDVGHSAECEAECRRLRLDSADSVCDRKHSGRNLQNACCTSPTNDEHPSNTKTITCVSCLITSL